MRCESVSASVRPRITKWQNEPNRIDRFGIRLNLVNSEREREMIL